MRGFAIIFLAVGLLASPAFALNGDRCNPDQFTQMPGDVTTLWCYKLLDDIATASGDSVGFDLRTATTTGGGTATGQPDIIRFELGTDNDCAAGSVKITSAQVAGGRESYLTSDATLAIDIAGLATTVINVSTHTSPIGAWIYGHWSGASAGGCGFDILMIGYRIKKQ